MITQYAFTTSPALPLELGGFGLRSALEGRGAALGILGRYFANPAPSVVAEAVRRVQLFSQDGGTNEATPNLAELAKAAAELQGSRVRVADMG